MAFEIVRMGELLSRGVPKRTVDSMERVPGLSGVRLLGEPPDDPRQVRIHAAWERAPSGAVLSGWAAAVLHGVPSSFLDGTSDGTKLVPIDLSVPADVGDYDTSGLRIRRSRVPASHRMLVDGLVVTTPARTSLDLARWAPRESRRLAMLDMAARHRLITPDTFADFLDPLGGLHRLANVRALLPMVSTRAESLPESEVRYHWCRAGLPTPSVNQPVHDRFGRFVGRSDLFDPESGLAAEYQGYWHLLDLAPELDRERIERFAWMNVTVVEIWKTDAGQVENKLQAGYATARRRDQRLDAWVCPPVQDASFH